MKIYRNCFIITRTKQTEDGQWVIDLPFPTYFQECFCEGKRFYHQTPQKDTEVMVHISYHPDDEKKVAEHKGYMGKVDETDKIVNNPKYALHWKETESDAKSVNTVDSVTGIETITKYDGLDKDKLSLCSEILKNKERI